MYRVIDSIKGQSIVFLHTTSPLPLETDIKFWPRMTLVHMYVRQHKASHLCVTRDDDGVEVWRAGSGGGVSIAAAIEIWLQERAKSGASRADANTEVNAFMLVLPLDKRVYFAKVEEGLVVSEQALVEHRALETITAMMEDAEQLPIRALDTGAHLCHVLKDKLSFEVCSLAIDAARFEFVWLALLRRKIPHQMLLLPPLLIAALVAFYINLRPAQDVLDETIKTIRPVIRLNETAFSASGALRAMANLMQRDVVQSLAKAKLTTMTIKGHSIVIRGEAMNFKPPVAIAEQYGGFFEITQGGWRVKLPEAFPENRLPLSELQDIQVVERIIRAASSVLGESQITSVRPEKNLKVTTLEIKVTSPSVIHIQRLALSLNSLPVRIESAECRFSPWVVTGCQMTLEIRTK